MNHGKRYAFLTIGAAVAAIAACKTRTFGENEASKVNDSVQNGETPLYPQAIPGCEKQRYLWNRIEATRYQSLPQWSGMEVLGLAGRAVSPFTGMTRDFMSVTMERESDEMPKGRFKHIHTYGSVAQIAFEAHPDARFTGLFRGVPCGLVRVSLATKPSEEKSVPGLAIKFLVDGRPSLNFMAMYSLDGQTGHNFFANDFSNFVAPSTSGPVQLLAKAFALVARDPTKVDVRFLSRVLPNGQEIPRNEISAPEQVYLIPNRAALRFADKAHEVREDFATIPAGTTLYEVFGRRANTDERIPIGKIVTRSQFVASEYGDANLFFRHERFGD